MMISGVNCGFKKNEFQGGDKGSVQLLEDYRGFRYKLVHTLQSETAFSDMELFIEVAGEWEPLCAAQGNELDPHPEPNWALIYMFTHPESPSKYVH